MPRTKITLLYLKQFRVDVQKDPIQKQIGMPVSKIIGDSTLLKKKFL